MKLSVIVPMYNSEKTIKSCLLSIVESFKDEKVDLEIVVVDDGSKDKSVEMVRELNKEISCINLYENEWGGVSKARNTALTKAVGDYIMFVDSDDQLLKWEGNDLEEILNKNDDLIFLETTSNYHSLDNNSKIEIIKEFAGLYPGKKIHAAVWAKFYKREFLNEIGVKFDQKLRVAEDVVFNLECLMKYNSISCYDILIYCREFSSSLHLFKENNLENEKIFRKEYTRILDSLGNNELDSIKDRFAITGFLFLLDRYYAPAFVENKMSYKEVYMSMKSMYEDYKKSLELNHFDFLLNRKDKILRKILAKGALKTALFLSVINIYKNKLNR